MNNVTLYLAGRKGAQVMEYLHDSEYRDIVAYVVVAKDVGCMIDYSRYIEQMCNHLHIMCSTDAPDFPTKHNIAIGWRRILNAPNLIVFHDSLLPRYRGFAPLVNAMINGESEVGATAFYASKEVDAGDVIFQEIIKVEYPTKIVFEIERMGDVYVKLIDRILHHLSTGIPLFSDSVWRDEMDYRIDWRWPVHKLIRFINAVGFPYKGAFTMMGGVPVRVLGAVEEQNIAIENREDHIGKVIKIDNGFPVVICADGMLKITEVVDDVNRDSVLPLTKLKTRMK